MLDKTEIEFTSINSIDTLTAAVTPTDTTDEIVWSTTNSSVATVSNGVVTAKGEGTCKITATCGSQSISCSVVVDLETTSTTKPCTGINLSSNTLSLKKGEQAAITVSLSPSDTTDDIKDLVITSNNGYITHSISNVTEGGALGLMLLLQHWFHIKRWDLDQV